MEIQFKGKRALVTGAGKGIGLDIAKRLAECGCQVVALSRTESDLIKLKREVNAIETLTLDISDWKKTEEALSKIGHVDLLVNNAGIGFLKPMSELTEQDVDKVFDTNLKGLINVTRIVTTNMIKRKSGGAVVNLSSQASMAGVMNHTIYCSTKGGIDAFTRAAALELGVHNIRVNTVNPTVIMTDMGRLSWSDPKLAKPMLEKIPLKRFGEVREVTDAVLYLLSDKSSMINGVCLPIDGGFLAC